MVEKNEGERLGAGESTEGAGRRRALLIHQGEGGPAVERGGGEGGAARRHGDSAAVAMVSMTLLRKPPCNVFLFLIFFFSFKTSSFSYLFWHLNIF